MYIGIVKSKKKTTSKEKVKQYIFCKSFSVHFLFYTILKLIINCYIFIKSTVKKSTKTNESLNICVFLKI